MSAIFAPFSSVLVANRGEIAVRIMRTARSLGLRTIAVFSDADRDAPHVALADQAIRIGPPPVGVSYLSVEAILKAARDSGAEAIHPGYGFLSENAEFARAVADAGLVFIGPSADAIETMGDKAAARAKMEAAGVPCVPGYQGDDQSVERLTEVANDIGYPIMVKAAAGGGGRGMRLVEKSDDLANSISEARSEAENAFGSGRLILEKAIQRPRHVEMQVFGDAHGSIIHLGERDCSIQRRYQKVVEEAPSPAVDPDLRARMGQAAVDAARAVDYAGAGTVEFLLDADDCFYFLEMNTRLQVEHPVTETITGLDLVALQLKVAAGEPLGLTQDDIRLSGHAMEVRLYAEDPANNFMPVTGPVDRFVIPSGEGVRVDAGIEGGGAVSPYYDGMVAKIVAHGPTRDSARRRLIKALGGTALMGVSNNRDFLIDVLGRPKFAEGEATTAFLEEVYGEDGYAVPAVSLFEMAIASACLYVERLATSRAQAVAVDPALIGWSSAGQLSSLFELVSDGETVSVQITVQGADAINVTLDEQTFNLQFEHSKDGSLTLVHGDREQTVHYLIARGAIDMVTPNRSFRVSLAGSDGAGAGDQPGTIVAPTHGRLISVAVEEGQAVVAGEPVATLEAMKMQQVLVAPLSGTVRRVAASAPMQVAAGDVLIEIEPEDASS